MTEKCLLGSEGGGCGEQEVITEARRVLVTGEFDVIDLDMTSEVAENNGMVCGGTMKVLLADVTGAQAGDSKDMAGKNKC